MSHEERVIIKAAIDAHVRSRIAAFRFDHHGNCRQCGVDWDEATFQCEGCRTRHKNRWKKGIITRETYLLLIRPFPGIRVVRTPSFARELRPCVVLAA